MDYWSSSFYAFEAFTDELLEQGFTSMEDYDYFYDTVSEKASIIDAYYESLNL